MDEMGVRGVDECNSDPAVPVIGMDVECGECVIGLGGAKAHA